MLEMEPIEQGAHTDTNDNKKKESLLTLPQIAKPARKAIGKAT